MIENPKVDKKAGNIAVSVLFSGAFYFSVLGYVVPLYTDYGNVAIYWLALLSSLSIVCFLSVYIFDRGWLHRKNTSLDLLVTLYVAWTVISFLANSLVNIVTGNAEHLVAQFQSLAIFLLTLVHYIWGRFSNLFGFSFGKFNSCVACLYFLACSSVLFYVLLTGDLYLARGDLGQRFPLLVVFWAWYFGGIWLVSGNKKYLLTFLLGSVVCLLSLTRAAYLQWILSAIAMLFAVGTVKMFRGIASVAVLLIIAILVFDPFNSLNSPIISVLSDRFYDFMLSDNLAESDSSTGFRLHVWERLIGYLFDNPIALIFGYGQVGPSYLPIGYIGDFGEAVTGTSAHSQYLDSLVRIGLPGLVLELGISFVAVFALFRGNTTVQIRIIAACLAGHLVFGAFHESVRWHVFGMVFWFFIGVIAQYLENRSLPYWNRGGFVRTPRVVRSGGAALPVVAVRASPVQSANAQE